MRGKHSVKSSKPNKRWLIVLLIVVLAGCIAFSGWKLYETWREYHTAAVEYADTSESFTYQMSEEEIRQIKEQRDVSRFDNDDADGELPEFQIVDMVWGHTVLFENMWKTNRDVVAWIESPGTVIDYPVLHGEGNDTYLYTTWKGTWNIAGSIFLNYRCPGDLSNYNTIIYGHNMKNGTMFHSLKDYASQSYYEEHPYIWYSTPDANYVLYALAGYVVEAGGRPYQDLQSAEEVRQFLAESRSLSDFTANYVVDGLDADYIAETANHCVVLSTCTYEYNDARYVVVCVPLLAY